MEQRLILASGSPRRKELLQNMNLSFDVVVSNVDETIDRTLSAEDLVQSLSYQKASSIAKSHPEAYVIGADTMVLLDNQVLGKPKTEENAFQMLHQLSGRQHDVLTGVTIIKGKQIVSFYERTLIEFWPLTENEIWNYVKTGEPMDKAGAYGIQGLGAYLVKKVNGDYFSIVGLPVARLMRELQKLGFKNY
ncbi:septum formation inhibitor Maf [Bacilli bacterium]|uniref:dTTP/UTP pyrophosphatase n=2 Tax=Bacillales TaxID=1385 RepID=A0ABR5MLG2_9BACI|nr:septum formation protein Maf [Bacilli bacterium VT-13-104]KPH76796.1 septum formation protein Maf [Oceanobacillus caeni]PZD83246.1 septum formation inhibitor Maf [Bacilli bacterium]MBU8792290.1 septum formation inhibitor Maf [Oceanobacillus caeni]PZD84372.1 septum formation inhibitor Maf [Bacilli bacterium]